MGDGAQIPKSGLGGTELGNRPNRLDFNMKVIGLGDGAKIQKYGLGGTELGNRPDRLDFNTS